MEDDLKILKVEYLTNGLLDHTQMLNLSLHDQTKKFPGLPWGHVGNASPFPYEESSALIIVSLDPKFLFK